MLINVIVVILEPVLIYWILLLCFGFVKVVVITACSLCNVVSFTTLLSVLFLAFNEVS